jgi:hypothetical protein
MRIGRDVNAPPLLCASVLALLAVVGCRDASGPVRSAPGRAAAAASAGAEVTGLGASGSGTATPGADRQEFSFAVTSAPGGTVSYKDWSVRDPDGSPLTLTVDPATDSATGIIFFAQTSATCVRFGGTLRASGSGALFAFTLVACDNASPGAGGDSFAIRVPTTRYTRSGTLTEGDITLSGTVPAPPPAAEITGVGATGSGTATPGADRQEFSFDATSAPGGTLSYKDWSFIRPDSSVPTETVDSAADSATGIMSFTQTSAACVTLGGILRVSDTRELFAFRIIACDNAGPGAGKDSFAISVPAAPYTHSGALTEGDITLRGTGATTGNLTVSTSSTGSSIPTSYTATVDGSQSQTIPATGSVTFTNLAAGSHTVVLANVPANCAVSDGPSQTVNVPSGGTATVSYSISCSTPNQPPSVNAGPNETVLLGVLYSLNWSFSDPDNNGPWSYSINWGDGSATSGSAWTQGSQGTGHTYLLIGSYTIQVTVTDAAGAAGRAAKTLTVLVNLGL